MTDEPIRVLLVEDEPAHAELVRRAFEARGDWVQLQIAESLSDARACLAPPAVLPHLIISDWRLPDGEGLELLSSGGERLTIPVMIMTSHGNERVAVDALKAGALDYVVKSETTLLDMPHLAERVLREWTVRAERERMQQALRASEEKFNKAFGSSPLAMTISDMASRLYLDVNDAFVRMTGHPRDELLGHTARDVQLWADLRDRDRMLALMAQQGFVRDLEVHFRYKTGEVRTDVMSVETLDLNNAPSLLTTFYDTTERRRAEDALRESEQKFRTIIEQSTEGFVLIDVTGQIIEWNQAQARISGIPREEAVGRLFWDVQLRMTVAEKRTLEQRAYFQAMAQQGLLTGESPVLKVKLQEMFGLADTPRVAGGKVPVTLHLLSPAQRPIQITQDLRGFWERTYPDVKKELKGRYPRHPWPNDPWSATPTRRATRRTRR